MSSRRLGRVAGILATYWTLFFLLDTGATLFEVTPGASAWYPSAGLHLALLLLCGLRYLPAVLAASIASGLVISSPSIPVQHLLLPNLILAAGYGAAAAWLRRRFSLQDVFSIRTVLRFCLVVLVLPAVVATLAVLSYQWTGFYPASEPLRETVLSWWVGDAVGLLTVTPLAVVLGLSVGAPDRLSDLERDLLGFRIDDEADLLVFAAEWAAVVGVLTVAFYNPFGDDFQFYLCFLPLLWIALRNGLPRTALTIALINAGSALALVQKGTADDMLEFQFFMLALALTGLILGVMVTERQRAVRALQQAGQALEQRLDTYAASLDGPASASPSLFADDWFSYSSDVLTDSENVLHRSTENLVALNEQLLRSEQRLLNVNADKDRFLSIISHDLKSPLFGIRGLTDVLLRQVGDEKKRHLLTLIRRSSSQAIDLLENLLTWARMQTGQLPNDPARHTLRLLVEDCFDLLRSNALQKDVALENSVDGDLEVYVDDFCVDTVLRNLVSNAIKFTPSGGYVSVDAETTDDAVVVSVSDTGVGIPAERQASVFDLTAAQSTSGTDDESGTGLGLHLCQELLHQRDCDIWVESEAGVGSTFYFTLPTPSGSSPVADEAMTSAA